MSMFTAFNISASGMTAQQLRTDVISQNIANANTTRTSDGAIYSLNLLLFIFLCTSIHSFLTEVIY